MQNLTDLNAEYMQIIQHQKEQLKTFKDEKKELEERLAQQEENMIELKQSQEHNQYNYNTQELWKINQYDRKLKEMEEQ